MGASGCGKSTIIKLLMRLYEHSSGQIKIDHNNIEDYDIHYLRNIFGAVAQEPLLFDETVGYNVMYNHVGSEGVVEAMRMAGMLKEGGELSEERGYVERRVGPRGSHLSGGQKQRVAIARTILRKPIIFLFDEVTSALDKENSEKIETNLL